MKVTIKGAPTKAAGSIEVGDVFEFDGSIFMRIGNDGNAPWNAIWLKDNWRRDTPCRPGHPCQFFFPDKDMRKVDAELVVTL